jgi:hypothetical protein
MGDDEGEARTADCTKCTKDSAGHADNGIEHAVDAELPRPEPEIFLLAGMTIASTRPGEAKAVRARAELQAAITERLSSAKTRSG